MSTIFSKIIAREIPAQFVYEDDICVVVMDKFPSVPGQTLVIPKEEIAYAFNLPDDIYQHLFMIAKKIVLASDQTFKSARSCLVIEGFEVPHVHLKIYPVPSTDRGLGHIMLGQKEASDESLEAQAAQLKTALEAL